MRPGLAALVEARRALPAPAKRRPIRERAKVSLSAVAEHVGVTKQAVQLWESGGREPSDQFVCAYVEALGIMASDRKRV